ncbi:hypothetical protein CPB85DRAFT_1290370 [Mucidula mucida]|nr:hypothetical protein CPB85DRAFT_1290370 [Mucidula mucida]
MSSRSFSFAYGIGLVIDRYRHTQYLLGKSHDEVSTLRADASEKDVNIRDLQKSLGDASAELQILKEASAGLEWTVQRVRHELLECRNALQSTRNVNHDLELRLEAQTEATALARDEVGRIRGIHEKTVQLLKTHAEELSAAQAYLNKTDLSSGADVISMVETLNGEIFQTAATIAEAFKFGDKQVEGSTEMESAYRDVVEILGPRMTDLLRSSPHHDDQLVIQIALQAAMCAYVEWIITSWYFEGRDEEQLLSNLYNHIQGSEDQAIAGRWRALTRRYAVEAFTEGSDIHQQLVDVVMETLVNILISAGLEVATDQVSDTMAAQFAGHTSEVVKRATELNSVIGQGIISCELSPIYLPPETAFDVGTMEDTFGRGPREQELILCTTDLGLLRSERQGDDWQRRVLMRPKVALQSGLEEPAIVEDSA